MRLVGVCLSGALERRIVAELESGGDQLVARARSCDELASDITGGKVRFLVVGATQTQLSSHLLSLCDVAGVRVVALASHDRERRFASDLGLCEVLDATASWQEIEAVFDGGPEFLSSDPPASEPRRGEVIAVWGPAGAPGRTTVAIAIAAELAAEGHSVVLADADTHSGAVAPSLGLLDEAPGFAAACRLAAADSLTAQELERVSGRYASPHGSFWVLTGIGRSHRWPELSGDRVGATLSACREWVDYTVVDTGFSLENDEEISSDVFAPQRNAATITALREADRVVAVGAGDPVSLSHFLRAHVDLLEIVEAERVLTVVNRIRSSVIGANPSAQVEQTLRRFGGITATALVPHDQSALDAAILSGKTLLDVAAKSGPRVALREFATTHLLPERAAAAKSRTLRTRLDALAARPPRESRRSSA